MAITASGAPPKNRAGKTGEAILSVRDLLRAHRRMTRTRRKAAMDDEARSETV